MSTPFKSYSICNGIIASGKLCDNKYFLITVLFVKTKEILMTKFELVLCRTFAIFRGKYIENRSNKNKLKIDLGLELE